MIEIKSLLGLDKKWGFVDYLVILLGSFIMAFGIGVFLVDARVVPGGVSGVSMVLHYLSDGLIPVGLTMWVLNIPLYIWGVRELGRQFGARTFAGFTMSSFFIDFLRGRIPGFHSLQLHKHPAVVGLLHDDFFLSILVGGTLLGIGLGIILKFRGSTGGSDIVAAIARKRWGINPGVTFIVVDSTVILIAGVAIHYKQLAFDRSVLALCLYAFFIVIVFSRLVDLILDGFDYARSAIIISSKNDEIAKVIMTKMSRGATALEGRGLYSNENRELLYTVLTRKEIGVLVQEVKEIDRNAFVIVSNVHEVLGEGFRPRI